MLVLDPQQAINLSKTHLNEIFKCQFEYRRDLIRNYKNHSLEPCIAVLQEFFINHTSIHFSHTQLIEMFDVFAYERAEVISYLVSPSGVVHNQFDTQLTDLLLDVVAQYFMHCDWPRYKDTNDNEELMKQWVTALITVSTQLGFKHHDEIEMFDLSIPTLTTVEEISH